MGGGVEPALFGYDLFGDPVRPGGGGPVASRFVFPPFTVLDARAGEWQERKRAWIAMGIESEIGRDANAYNTTEWLRDKNNGGDPIGGAIDTGVSIFDPVLCEMAYRWFAPPDGLILDPFAGGSVRGIVAGALGRRYHGIDLRAEQVEANREQADRIPVPVRPTWVVGDAAVATPDAPPADFVFSCPPYGDLEVYSDDPADLSRMEWRDFLVAYRAIIASAVDRLRPDRFACFVVGDFRDRAGHYRNFVGHTVDAFRRAGCGFYNDGVLVTSVGSASMRVTKQFDVSRKFAKTHQNVLVFVKGDPRVATRACAGADPYADR